MTPEEMVVADEDIAIEALKASGAKESVIYAGDAISIDFYGCARVGNSKDVVCAFDLVGSGYDWTFGGCEAGRPSATDENGMDYRGIATVATFPLIQQFGHCRGKDLVEGVRTEARLRFDGVNSNAESFALVKWVADARTIQTDPAAETMEFRDITIE